MEFRLKIARTLVAAALSWASPALAAEIGSSYKHHDACNFENLSCHEIAAPAKPPSMRPNALPKALDDWPADMRFE